MKKTTIPRFQQVQHQFTRHLRDPDGSPAPDGIEDRRMAIYRRLIFNNIKNLLGKKFPVLKSVYGEQRWSELVRDFLRRHQASTPMFPEIGQEFIVFIHAHRGSDCDDPGYLLELAHYEWSETELLLDATRVDPANYQRDCDLLDDIPVLSPLTRVLGYHWPVHRISKDHQPTQAEAQPVWLLLYRNRKQRVSFMQLQAASAALCELLQHNRNDSGRVLVTRLAEKLGLTADQAFIDRAHDEMRQLQRKGVLPGCLHNGDAGSV
jgi:hypothetical protein